MANAYRAAAERRNKAFGPSPSDYGAPKRLRVPAEPTGVKHVYRRPALRYNSDRPRAGGMKPRVPRPVLEHYVTPGTTGQAKVTRV